MPTTPQKPESMLDIPDSGRSPSDVAEAIAAYIRAFLRIWFWMIVAAGACMAGYVVVRTLIAFAGVAVDAIGLEVGHG